MIDLTQLKRKPKSLEYIGTRINTELKEKLENFCKDRELSVSTVLVALIEDLLKGETK